MNTIKNWMDKNLQGDPVIWSIIFIFSLISIVVVYSSIGTLAYKHTASTESYLFKHMFMVFLGLIFMWLCHHVNYRYYSSLARIGLWISVPLLLYTFFYGISINHATRWLRLPIIDATFQPSDFASLCLIINLASMLSKRQLKINQLKETLIPMLGWCGTICGLIALTNLSTALILLITCMMLLFIGRVPIKYLVLLALVGVIAGSLAIRFGIRGETAKNRILNFVQDTELSFQAQQGRIAVASGGVFGKGPGNSSQRNILPHPYSDFIYAIIIEEYGLIGGALVLILYLLLLFRGVIAAYHSKNAFSGLLAAGLSFDIAIQAMVNMGVVVGLGPITGQPLPFISMGGTAMVFTSISVGIIQSVRKEFQHET